MLQTISWKAYLISVGLGVGFYYGWWLVRYYPGWRRSRPGGVRGRKDKPDYGGPAGPPVKGGISELAAEKLAGLENGIMGVPAEAKQSSAQTVAPELPFSAVVEKSRFLPVIESTLKIQIVKLMEQAEAERLAVQDVLVKLQQLLTADPYPRLKGTGFQERIDALIVQQVGRYGSIHLNPEVVSELWRG